jgi:hypothetical protein
MNDARHVIPKGTGREPVRVLSIDASERGRKVFRLTTPGNYSPAPSVYRLYMQKPSGNPACWKQPGRYDKVQ